uniref:Uncharacterized protein n=1 Tax=Tetranychus urticae TaxID=32264 RepID=T1K7Q8_TETUR
MGFTEHQKALICTEYAINNFAMRATQRSLDTKYGFRPSSPTIRRIYDNFLTRGVVVWGHLQEKVFSRDPKPQTLSELRTAITEEFERNLQEMSAHVSAEFIDASN